MPTDICPSVSDETCFLTTGVCLWHLITGSVPPAQGGRTPSGWEPRFGLPFFTPHATPGQWGRKRRVQPVPLPPHTEAPQSFCLGGLNPEPRERPGGGGCRDDTYTPLIYESSSSGDLDCLNTPHFRTIALMKDPSVAQ